SAAASKPACSRSPAIRSESWKFIWQPNVSMRYLRATSTLRFRSFAFAFRRRFAFRLPAPAAGAHGRLTIRQHLARRGPQAVGDRRASEHPAQFLHTPRLVEPRHRRARAAALDPLLDREVRIGARRDLREVRDAEYLKRGPQRTKLPADHFSHAPADT